MSNVAVSDPGTARIVTIRFLPLYHFYVCFFAARMHLEFNLVLAVVVDKLLRDATI